jgi:phosphohistidine phosphatase
MNIYLLRHAIAAAKDDPAFESDSERPLTNKGIKKFRKAARGIDRLGVPFDAILTSPLVRARQTADIVAEILGQESCVDELAGLAPDGSPEHLVSELGSSVEAREHILLVGHEPFLGKLAKFLLSGKNDADGVIPLRKGGICRIEIDAVPPAQPGQIHWLLTPKQLRLIGR